MSRTRTALSKEEQEDFHSKIHLIVANEMVALHNKCMLLSLHQPMALSIAEQHKNFDISNTHEEPLQSHILLCIGQQVMLCTNLCV